MPRMTAARAAVEILKREGVSNAFGVPGAAINPFYAALKASGGVNHTLARHVEGASHMAEGYTRAKAGNICHLSTAGSVEIVRWAKSKGWNVTAETGSCVAGRSVASSSS
ncbi:thiamine pyrophosphate-binding protein, partial [Streptomyces globisporus]